MLRFLLWRLLGALGLAVGAATCIWLAHGGIGRALRRGAPVASTGRGSAHALGLAAPRRVSRAWPPVHLAVPHPPVASHGLLVVGVLALACALLLSAALLVARWRARRRRRYVRMRVVPYRTDRASAEAVVAMLETLHKRLLARWWRRLLRGQPSLALELHCSRRAGAPQAWLAVCAPLGCEQMVEAALRGAYPNCSLSAAEVDGCAGAAILRLKKSAPFIRRAKVLDHFEHEREPPVNGLITSMAASGGQACVQIALTPAPASFERFARHLHKRHEQHLARVRGERPVAGGRSSVEQVELRGGLEVQHRPLFFTDLRIVSTARPSCERIASELRARSAENRLVERGTGLREGLLGIYRARIERGEGNPLPAFHRGVFASTELAAIWHLPSLEYLTVPFARSGVPVAPAPPGIYRPAEGGTLRDAIGPVSIHPHLRKQNTAVPGTVEQGKSSYLVATIAEDLRRERCAVILLDPKGDAADAAVSLVPPERTCTLLDFSHPTCGFSPLAVDAPADVIADYVVAALKNLFTDVDIRASSDRYLRNAIIAVLAYDRQATLWDAARLLSVGGDGYAYRRAVGERVRALPEFKEISDFFTAELSAQLADARSVTTAKLDAPVNKLARLLNSASIKRVLLNESLRVDFERVIAGGEVLVVKGALGGMGAGNTAVLMQLLIGMLDAALSRQQDLVPAAQRVAVALKVDEAPLVLNRGFAETMALKRSAGLETVACWQADAQWTDREVAEQLDALFAHRVYFATASARDARDAVKLTMSEFSDAVRPGIAHLSALGRPDARLHLPRHHAIASWTTPAGRQAPFVAQTLPLEVDEARIALHAARQREHGGRHLGDLRQPHWAGAREPQTPAGDPSSGRPGGEAHAARAGARTQLAFPDANPPPTQPATPAESYRELVELDRAHSSVRSAKPAAPLRDVQPDQLDLQILSLVVSLGHVLTSQVHRRFNPGRAPTTTQRRLKRLADAGLIARFQFHRRDGGGVPMCCAATPAGVELLERDERLPVPAAAAPPSSTPPAAGGERALRQARHDVHVAGWVLALERLLVGPGCLLYGASQSVISPPQRASADGQMALGLAELRLPAGRVAHGFTRTDARGEQHELGRFETLRPDAIVQAPSAGAAPVRDFLVEADDRVGSQRWLAKLERYDHFLTGWSEHTSRYGRRAEALALVVFVCRSRSRARECAGAADAVLRACRAYAGEYPQDWEYPARERVVFTAERDAHEGFAGAYGVPMLPPPVRVNLARGDPRAGEAVARHASVLPAERDQARASQSADHSPLSLRSRSRSPSAEARTPDSSLA